MNQFQLHELDLSGKRALITGVAGVIGCHLADALLQRGAKVIGIDNFVTGTFKNISHLQLGTNFLFFEKDACRDVLYFSEKIDYVFHFASPASPVDFPRIPIEIMRVNSEGTYRLLELAKSHKAQFIMASTSEVYGNPQEHPQKESYVGHVNCIGPRAAYDESKRYAEAMTSVYRSKYGLDSKIIRIFNTYGPKMRAKDGRVIPNFISQALRGENFTVYGDGSQTRSFCYVGDLVRGILAVTTTKEMGPFNLGNPEERTILDTCKIIKELTQSLSEIEFLPLPKDDPLVRRPDIGRIQSETGFYPEVSFKEGMLKTIEHFKREM